MVLVVEFLNINLFKVCKYVFLMGKRFKGDSLFDLDLKVRALLSDRVPRILADISKTLSVEREHLRGYMASLVDSDGKSNIHDPYVAVKRYEDNRLCIYYLRDRKYDKSRRR